MNTNPTRRATVAIAAALIMATTAHATVLYKITDIGNLGTGDFANALGINDHGIVVGDSNLTPGADVGSFGHAWIFDPAVGTITDLGTLGGPSSTARDINNAGLIVGDSRPDAASNDRHPFVIDPAMPGVLQDLGTLGGDDARAYAVNNLGEIVGGAELASTDTHAMYINYGSGGSMQDLGTLGGTNAFALDISENSRIVGFSTTGTSFPVSTETFYIDSPTDTMEPLGTLAFGGGEEEE